MFKGARCEKCSGTGEVPVSINTGNGESSLICDTCSGTGYVTLTDKTIRLPEDGPDSPVYVTCKLNGEVIVRGRTLEYKPAQWLSDESEEGETKRG